MPILLDCMAGGLGVERGGCEGSDGLRDKHGSSLIFVDAFFTNEPQNRSLHIII